ncbi:hypothetical protein DM01DRAFT_242149, partial [Hesseltinella vesiculosa]
DDDNDSPIVTWKLNLSATLMTLDTNIQTLAGLEQVLEQLGHNIVPPQVTSPPVLGADSLLSPPPPPPPSPSLTLALSQVSALTQVNMIPVDIANEAMLLAYCNNVQLIKQCVQLFVMCDGALFVDVPHLLSLTERLLITFQQQQQQQPHQPQPPMAPPSPQEMLLVFSICTVMVPHVFVHRHNDRHLGMILAQCYASRANLLLQEFFDVPHLVVLQAMLILSVYPQSHASLWSASRAVCSPILTAAIRLATTMRLHCLDLPDRQGTFPYHQGLPPNEIERRRRLMWMLFCADHFAHNNTSGQTGYMDVDHWHVDFPQVLADDKLSRRVMLFSQSCRVVMIRKMQLFRSTYAMVLQSPNALANCMDSLIFNKYLDTPLELHKDDLEPLLLDILHCHTLIEVLVPFLPARYL